MAKQKKRTGKRMGPGRPAVVVDEVRQRLFNKHFDEGYSADDLWKQNRDCISKRISPPSVVICTPQNREASGTASLCSSTGR